MSNDHVYIPDAHSRDGDDFERFTALGEYCVKYQPEYIISAGDWSDVESLCSYDRGKRGFEGRRYHKDIKASRDALSAFAKPINDHNWRRAANHKSQYKPKKIVTLGNHEHRVERAIDMDATLEGTISTSDFGFEDFGWKVYPFLTPATVDGITYQHFFVTGVSGKPVGGLNPARSILNKHMSSCTSAHTHVFDYAIQTGPAGNRAQGLVGGCFFDYPMPYAVATEFMWWRGFCHKHNVENGVYDLETVSLKKLLGGDW